MGIRKFILRFYNPIITITYNDFTLSMPFSHTIFINQKHFPSYDMQLHKIAQAIIAGGGGEGGLAMIDVGANIGDTVVFTNIVDGQYLLIEGEKSYNQLIERNLKQNHFNQTRTIIENTFIGDCQGYFSNTLQDGSGSLTTTEDCESGISTLTLDEVIEKHNFQPNFIKIDTDGFDFKVIRSATKTLKQYAPVLFFEWDKFFLENQGEDPLSIFPLLQELGYSDIFVFDNFGTLLCKERVDNVENLGRLLNYTKLSRQNIYYYDLLVIHDSQKHIFDSCNIL